MNSKFPQIGERIRFLRRSRNWTLAELAEKIGIREGPLGRIELGKNLPSAKVLYNLSKALDVSVELFFDDGEQCPLLASSFGNKDVAFVMLSPGDDIPRSLLSACQSMINAFHTLEDICNVPRYAGIPLMVPFEPHYEGMDRLASRMRSYFGIADAIVFDYFELFETFGLRILMFPFPRGAEDFRSVSFFEESQSNAFFFINARNAPDRQLFSLALELGRILISHRMKLCGDVFTTPQPHHNGDRPINPVRAARRFALSFLMPSHAVKFTLEQLGIDNSHWTWELLLRIKDRFGVSAESFLYRLMELDAVSPEIASTLKDQIYSFYEKNAMAEPGSTRRLHTPNGRFFDLYMAAEARGWKGQSPNEEYRNEDESGQVSEVVSHYKIIKK
ncbi:MAG: ImmA/IrrE family metallo-endopeptidase [Desulfamplus sp.]|nr:ImmA/IrrE family metallo-endopeptidase [Desulfamplus sp.]